jgi:Fe2+ or Zn2+ uptake regulation protein
VQASGVQSEKLLIQNRLRRTPARIGVIELLSRARRPLSVPEILARLHGVDTVTIYRTLNTFVRRKLVHKVRSDDRTWRYAAGDAAARRHLHPHFVCDECGRVECLERSRIPGKLVQALAISRAYAVIYPEVVLHGMCPKCQ